MRARDPFECWYTVAEAAQRLGVSERTAARYVEADAGLLRAARFFGGCRRLPWSAWEQWLGRQPDHEAMPTAERVARRGVTGRYTTGPVHARTEGEARRLLLQMENDEA